MNPLVLLPLLAAATLAAPGGVSYAFPGGTTGLVQPVVAQPALAYAAPAVHVAQVQLPVTKTVHYESRPVVTGYSSTILKPSIVQQTVAAPVVQLAAPQQVVVKAQPIVQAAPVQQIVQTNDAVVVESRAAVAPAVVAAPAPVVQVAQPQLVQFRQPQAGDFGPLVTQEKVLAPVRQHTQVTPQFTQVQPEVTVRKVIHDVPVQQPIYHTPVVHQTVVAQPQVQTIVAQPQVFSQGVFSHGVQQVGLRSVVV